MLANDLVSGGVEAPPALVPAGVTRVVAGASPEGFGGGSIPAPRDLITDAQREAIHKEIDASVERLRAEGRLAQTAVEAHPAFGWPLRMAAGVNDPGYHGISNYVDLDPNFPGLLLDFNCGDRTYDTANGYNHAGTDFFTWPWSWRKMDRGEIEIVAAAPGQIIYRNDGNLDRSCDFNSNDWNAVYVQHADGSTALYGHMKNGSPTAKPVGSMVAQGEYLGVVGSSGNSTGPHLHFEVEDAAFHLIEPWAGPCNALNVDSWWASQRPYYDSAVDRITTGFGAPNLGACPSTEAPNIQSSFAAGATVFFTAYYSDQLITQASTYTIYRPDGSVYSQWIHSSPAPFYAESYWFWSFTIPAAEPQGTWRFSVDFQSSTNERSFTIGSPAACGAVPEFTTQGEVVKVDKITTFIRLTWGGSCNPADTDYVVYEGLLGNFGSHTPIRCTTSGTKAALVTPAAGNRYYLIAPRNAAREGSVGTTSSGAERPGGVTSCVARFALPCP
jgi:murein DD-endopeptidase MepM/ murein hydrolase activator NlpD